MQIHFYLVRLPSPPKKALLSFFSDTKADIRNTAYQDAKVLLKQGWGTFFSQRATGQWWIGARGNMGIGADGLYPNQFYFKRDPLQLCWSRSSISLVLLSSTNIGDNLFPNSHGRIRIGFFFFFFTNLYLYPGKHLHSSRVQSNQA